MTDFFLLEQLHRMIKEIPKPRLMFNKGISVRGFFRPYMSFSDYTKALIFSNSDEITPVIVRFSSMLGDKGTADTIRNIKNMSVKFMTDKGDHDVICSSIPVQFICDESKLIELVMMFSVRRYFDGINKSRFWQFIVDNPEALNGAVHLYSNEGLVKSYLNIKWYSVNTMIWYNDKGEKWLTRYKWLPVYDDVNRTSKVIDLIFRNEAEFIAGFDPDIAINEVERKIINKEYPAFELFIQMIKISCGTDSIFTDNTLIWDEKKAPYMAAGVMILDEMFANDPLEDSALYISANMIEGIQLCSNDLTDLIDHLSRFEALERGMIK